MRNTKLYRVLYSIYDLRILGQYSVPDLKSLLFDPGKLWAIVNM